MPALMLTVASPKVSDVEIALRAKALARAIDGLIDAGTAIGLTPSQRLAYVRLHGSPRIYYSDYDDAALATLGKRLERQRRRGIPVWCILDNTASGAALGNVLALTADEAITAAGG